MAAELKIAALFLAYRPQAPLLRRAVDAIAAQVDSVAIVDNESTPQSSTAISDALAANPRVRTAMRAHAKNLGVAAGFNAAFDLADELGADAGLLFDQDSVARPGLVAALRDAYRELSARFRVGVLQAANVDPRGYRTQDQRLAGYYRRRGLYADERYREGMLFLNSGALIPTAVFRAAGGFDPAYFVDFADFDLGLRIRAKGHRIFEVQAAELDHNEAPANGPTPRRLYYACRDGPRLLRAHARTALGVTLVIEGSIASRLASGALRSPSRGRLLSAAARGFLNGRAGEVGELAPGIVA